jgi:hypothetical protein
VGFNTTVFFLNDQWSDIKNDPEGTVQFIGQAMNDGGQNRNYVTVMRSAHADTFRLYSTWQNQIIEINPDDDTVKKLAETKHGREHLAAVIQRSRRLIHRLDNALDTTEFHFD